MASSDLRLLAVHAHPDDESSKGAASAARYAAEGVDVLVVSCTGGERGDVLNPRLQHDPEVLKDITAYRVREMDEAAKALGVRHHWLGFVDSGLPEGDPLPPLPEGCFALEPLTTTVPALVRIIREQRPQVMTTYDENGGYPHPDHIMTHVVSMAAAEAAADPEQYPELGEAWRISKIYYHASFSWKRLTAVHEAILAAGLESPFTDWLNGDRERRARPITCQVPCAEYFGHRDRALLAHATQIDPDGFFFAVPREIEAEVWPWEDFELVRSDVEVADRETDLFAGIRAGATS